MKTLQENFVAQSIACNRMGSPFMGRLMKLFADRLAPGSVVADRMLGWPGDTGPQSQSVPLRIAGALHAIVLDGIDPELAAAYPPNNVSDDALWQAVNAALVRDETRLMEWLDSAPQTNEVRRAAALIPAFHMVAAATGLPLALHELGCSGGLNLRADQFHLAAGDVSYGPTDSAVKITPDWTGPAPRPADLQVIDRRGVDLNPLNPTDPFDQLRLRAYLWPDQADRLQRTSAAIGLAESHPAQVERGDAIGWLEQALQQTVEGQALVIYHTIAWQYFPDALQARGEELLQEAGNRATLDRPLARISIEADGAKGAAMTLQTWPDGILHQLGRVDFHGRWLQWDGPIAL
ncbi:MAG: DUF2332 family protein [Pseudomonadota bacterium]